MTETPEIHPPWEELLAHIMRVDVMARLAMRAPGDWYVATTLEIVDGNLARRPEQVAPDPASAVVELWEDVLDKAVRGGDGMFRLHHDRAELAAGGEWWVPSWTLIGEPHVPMLITEISPEALRNQGKAFALARRRLCGADEQLLQASVEFRALRDAGGGWRTLAWDIVANPAPVGTVSSGAAVAFMVARNQLRITGDLP